MSFAVMPLSDYKAACDKIREKADLTEIKFEETDFGYIRSVVFTAKESGEYIFTVEVKDENKFNIDGTYYAYPEWNGDTSPGYFTVINDQSLSAYFTEDETVRIFIGDYEGLKPSDIITATLSYNGEIVENFVEPPKIKSGELADKVDEVYWTAAKNFGLKGKGQGELVHFENVHPIEHKAEVRLRSKNLVNILAPDYIPSNGYEVLDNNSIRVYTNRGYTVGVKYYVYAPVGTQVTMSYEYELGGEANDHYNIVIVDGVSDKVENTVTKTMPSSGKIEFEFARLGGNNDKNGWVDIKNFQVQIGTTATAYAPYIADFSDCKVKVSGKNLLNINREQGKPLTVDASYNITNGLEFEFDKYYLAYIRNNKYYHNYGSATIDNNTISLTVSNVWFGIGFPLKTKPNVTYTLSAEIDTTKVHIAVTYYDSLGNYINLKDGTGSKSLTFTTPSNCDFIVVSLNNMTKETTTISNVQLEIGTTATEYEPYNEASAEYTAAADGTVEGVKSISPIMNLMADKAGAVIDAECFLDPQAVITDLTNTVITLGGEI